VKDKKMSFIRYFEGAQPGKKRNIENEKTEKSKEYEARRKAGMDNILPVQTKNCRSGPMVWHISERMSLAPATIFSLNML
jgi:hypothetical protein